MSMSQLLLTFLVALLVFGPAKLPMLARHLGRVFARFNYYKQHIILSWQNQIQQELQEQQLQKNREKAREVDSSYTDSW